MPITIYPTSLKYKNTNGQFQSATAIKGDKGDKGDTYNLTESDKKDIAASVDYSVFVESVSGSTVTITGQPNMRYVCGEVISLNFTPPASGTAIIRFTSGSTVTVLTLPSTVKLPEWFDPTSLETNTIYEICITDGIYGAVMSWAQ